MEPPTAQTAAPGRRALAGRPAATVSRLLDATVEELREVGYDRLSIRNVCRRARVTHGTTYGYFSSKQHLVTEAYWQFLQEAFANPVDGVRPLDRLRSVLRQWADALASEPELTSAAMSAVLSLDPDVSRLRTVIGQAISARLRDALGPDVQSEVLEGLNMAVNGALLEWGTGHRSFDALPQRLLAVARLLLDGATVSARPDDKD